MKCFEILKIAPTKDKKKIRHAYASLSKQYHMETDTELFEQLKEAYTEALEYAASNADADTMENKNGISREISNRNQGDIEAEGVFFETDFLQKDFEEAQLEKIRTLSGIVKIQKDIRENIPLSFNYFKEYVMSKEFLDNQYDTYFITVLSECFNSYADSNGEKQVAEMFLPFAFMYGLLSERGGESTFLQTQGALLLLSFAENCLGEATISQLMKREDVSAFLVNAQWYHALSWAYYEDIEEKKDFVWDTLWSSGLGYDILPVIKIKNDFSFWKMFSYFVEVHQDIKAEVYIKLEKVFELSQYKKSSKKEIFEPVVKAIEKNMRMPIGFFTMGANDFLQARKKPEFNSFIKVYLQQNMISYDRFAALYGAYYFVPERTPEEQEVFEEILKYTEYEERYWKQVEIENEEEEYGDNWN